jgi:hypothetical protein
MSSESPLTRIPINTSFLQPTKFGFTFPTLPFLRYFCQSVIIPGVSTSPVRVSSPFVDTYRHGDKLVFDQLTVTALIDEDLRLWEETYNWIVGLTKPDRFPQYIRSKDKKAQLYHDGVLTINTNANLPNIRITFTDCHPISLSPIQFATTETADTLLTSDIVFRYDQMEIVRLMPLG